MKSKLLAIIKRLEAMVETDSQEAQVRRFESDGEERCVITYLPPQDSEFGTFEMAETNSNQVYQFDDIDLVAMEIYELLQ